MIALASEYPRLTPAQRASVTHIIADDGDWTQDQIDAHVAMFIHDPLVAKKPKHEDYES